MPPYPTRTVRDRARRFSPLSSSTTTAPTNDASQQLRHWMRQADIRSWRSLAEAANLSLYQIRQLRAGNLDRMRLGTLEQVARALGVSSVSLIAAITGDRLDGSAGEIAQVQRDYDHLKVQTAAEKQALANQWQRESLDILEPWLLNWYRAVAAIHKNPEVPARALLTLLEPLDRLLETWHVEQIAPMDEEVTYDPRWHELSHGNAEPGDHVRIVMPGFRHGGTLLHRALVVPVV